MLILQTPGDTHIDYGGAIVVNFEPLCYQFYNNTLTDRHSEISILSDKDDFFEYLSF